jgi:tetratricopeptide (TPR) repeat protein
MIKLSREIEYVEDAVQYELLILWDEAREHTQGRQFEKAIEIYKYIILMYPNEPEAHEYADANLADIYLTLRKTDLSQEHIRRALTRNPEKPEYHYILGFIYTLDNEWERSVKEFQIALKAKPENAEYLRGLGWATTNSGDKKQGILILNKALRIQPDDVNILTDLAVSYLGVAEFHLARKYARMARSIDPANSQVMGTLWMIDYASHLAHMEEE